MATAVEAYEQGEDPALIAAALLKTRGPQAAEAWTRHWEQAEGWLVEDEDWGPQTPDEFRGLLKQQLEAQQAQEQLMALAAENQRRAEQTAEVTEAAEAWFRQTPDARKYEQTISGLLAHINPAGITDAKTATETLAAGYRAAKEAERATWAANVLADFDEDRAARSGFLERKIHFDRQTAVAANFGKVLNPEAVAPRMTRAEISAQLDEDLFGEERVREAGWNLDAGNEARWADREAARRRRR